MKSGVEDLRCLIVGLALDNCWLCGRWRARDAACYSLEGRGGEGYGGVGEGKGTLWKGVQ